MAFEDAKELQLALEIADILDELKILKNLFEKQRMVVEALDQGLEARIDRHRDERTIYDEHPDRIVVMGAMSSFVNVSDHLKSISNTVGMVETEAKETYRSVSSNGYSVHS